jgi:hypothetical protein
LVQLQYSYSHNENLGYNPVGRKLAHRFLSSNNNSNHSTVKYFQCASGHDCHALELARLIIIQD